MRVSTKISVICSCVVAGVFLFAAATTESFSQVPRAISYQGVIQKDGSPLTGDGLFLFTLYRGTQIVWRSQPLTGHVNGGLFSTILGPFPDSVQLNGVDSLGISFDGAELAPRVALTSVAYSLYAEHAAYADSSRTPGPKGPKGDRGDPGSAGQRGDAGPQGLRGDPGAAGAKGDAGLQGSKGDKGDLGLQGLKGDRGDAGSQGLKGDKGDLGLQGLKGDRGDAGPQGLKGDLGSQGLKGDKGDFGPQGLKGDKGDAGPQGIKGDRGDLGVQGVKGDKGDKGDPGTQGPKGDRGDSGAFASTDNQDGSIVYSVGNIRLVRTGSAGGFRLEIPSNPGLSSTYSATWFSGDRGPSQVEAHRGTVSFGSAAAFDVGAAHRFSIMFKVDNVWAKVDLFRANTTDSEWYGFSMSN